MLENRKGHIVEIASLASYVAIPGLVSYAGTKAAVLALHEGLTMELTHRYPGGDSVSRPPSPSVSIRFALQLLHDTVSTEAPPLPDRILPILTSTNFHIDQYILSPPNIRPHQPHIHVGQ